MRSVRAEAMSLYNNELNEDGPTLVLYRGPNAAGDAVTIDWDQDVLFADFVQQGERLTDVVELLAFARRSEDRGHLDEALQLYGWTAELLDDCPQFPERSELSQEIRDSILRLRSQP